MTKALDMHIETCMCDKCISRRVIERKLKEEQDKLAQGYIARRGGLDRPPNKKMYE